MKTESNVKLDKILYMPLPDGLADVWLRENIEEVEVDTGEGKQTVWTADEVYFRTAKSQEEIEANFDEIFAAGGTGEVFDEEPEETGEVLSLSARVQEIEDLIVEIAEIEVAAGNLQLEDIPEHLQEEVRVKLDDDTMRKDL